ncbi:DUF6089 family protein [Brumimicrobium mesophilum]|uniref:DUF6089 family protein n=1 Tax=Brumimicrobium mesophilum TaxID=392717 RepID=UPI000D1415E1|nr:DUF6089 family protein [Brumimicrobium mesophilum]
MKNIIIAILIVFSPLVYAQKYGGFGKSRNWFMNKYEAYFSIGATSFLGDLGGLNREGTQKSIVDIDFQSTRIGGSAGYRYRISPRWATSSQIYFGMLSGDDANTDEIVRRSRNLSFRSPILELSQRIEFIVYANEKMGSQRSRGLSSNRKNVNDIFYLFTGISGFYFNPQTKIDGKWTNLHNLRTEGQGLPGGAEEYSRFSAAIPLGIGFKFAITEYWKLGLEVSYNKTFTDYIDDVSTNYYDPTVLNKQGGSDAVYAGNPSIENHNWFVAGQQRGNSDDNDAYLFTSITFTRKLNLGGR